MIVEVNDLIIDKYQISLNILNDTRYIVYSPKKEIINNFLNIVSGINKPKKGKILFNKNEVFDNKDYFKNRVIIKMNEKHLETLNPKVISENIYNKYKIIIDDILFKKNIDLLHVRRETKYGDEYKFTEKGIMLANYSLIESMNIKNVIFSDFNYNKLNDFEKQIIEKSLFKSNKYDTVIIGTNDIKQFLNNEFKYIIFGEKDVFIVNPKTSKFIYCLDNINLKNKMFVLEDSYVICYHDYTKEELKELSSKKIKYKEIDFNNLIKIIERSYNEKNKQEF